MVSPRDCLSMLDVEILTSLRQGGIVLIAETVSLGILSLPSVLAVVGLIPGIILILVLSFLSTCSGYALYEFRKQYPHVQNFGDAVEVIGNSFGMGRLFQEVFGYSQVLFQVFVMAAHLQTWTICLNTLTNSSTCTVVWAAVGLIVFWICNWPRTLKYTSWMSMACEYCLNARLRASANWTSVLVHCHSDPHHRGRCGRTSAYRQRKHRSCE